MPPTEPTTVHYALALDLLDDPQAIAQYEAAHQRIWPQVRDHLRAQGVREMQSYRLGTRLFMWMEVDPAVYSAQAMAEASLANPHIVQWEALMGRYQVPTPWTPAGVKWAPMAPIFSLRAQ